jgi:hypothetical protein
MNIVLFDKNSLAFLYTSQVVFYLRKMGAGQKKVLTLS